MDPFTAFLLSMAAGGAGNMLSGMGQGSPGSSGYDIVNFNDPYDSTSRAMASSYLQDVISALRAGQVPDWMNRYTEPLQADLLRQNRNQFFGREGSAGGSVADIAQSTGAMAGLGGQAGQAPVNKALADYADRMSGINQYIASIKNQYMQNASQSVPGQLYTMGQRDNHIVPINHSGSSGDPLMQGIGQALGGIDWSKLSLPSSSPKTKTTTSGGYLDPSFGLPSNYLQGVAPAGQYVPPQRTFDLSSIFPLTGGH